MANSRIYINGRFLTQRMTGVQRYAIETLLALDALLAEEPPGVVPQLTVLAPPGTARPQGLRKLAFRTVGRGGGVLWEQLWLPVYSHDGLLWSFCPTGPLIRSRQVVTMHDAAIYAVAGAYSWKFRLWYRTLLPMLAHRAPFTMTVSEFSRDELNRYLGLAHHRLHVTGEGWQHVRRVAPDRAVLDRHGLTPGRYVLAAGSLSPHKNFSVITRALGHLPEGVQVVVAGAVNDAIFGQEDPRAVAGLIRPGYVSDAELLALYEHALAFVYPSLYEGFGLPPLEAMALGCPAICANAASMPEVCGDGALYFEPHDERQLAALVRRLLADPGHRDDLVRRGQARLGRHSWQAAARVHLDRLTGLCA